MVFLLISVICSVTVSVLLKIARRCQVDVYQAITWGYLVAAILTIIFFRPELDNFAPHLLHSGAPLWVYAALAFLLPFGFVLLALSVRQSGIVRTDVAQRLSLLISLIAAFYLFGEVFTMPKMIGIALGLVAVLLCIHWNHADAETGSRRKWNWLYPLSVFVMSGLVDICFKEVALIKAVPYFTSLLAIFVMAGVISLLINIGMWLSKKLRWNWRGAVGGLFLGIFNFGNILFYVRGHQVLTESPALVFTAMNVGVVVLGAIVGLFLFREKLSKLNMVGVTLAIIAILVMAYGQLKEQNETSNKTAQLFTLPLTYFRKSI